MLNSVTLQGRLCSDPETRYTATNKPVVSLTIAVDRDYKNGDEKQVDFVPCVFFGNEADMIQRFMHKGSMAIVHGRLQSREWTDKNNQKRKSWEVIADRIYFGESKKKDEQSPFSPGVTGRVDKSKFQELPETDGDLPF